MTDFSMPNLDQRMKKSLAALKDEFAGLRTGRATTSLLDPIMVEAYGSKMPMNQVATVSVPEARMLSVQVWDKGMTQAVEKAIRESSLGGPEPNGRRHCNSCGAARIERRASS